MESIGRSQKKQYTVVSSEMRVGDLHTRSRVAAGSVAGGVSGTATGDVLTRLPEIDTVVEWKACHRKHPLAHTHTGVVPRPTPGHLPRWWP